MSTTSSPTSWVPVGRISGLYGVRGWVKFFSYTQPRDALLSYQPWFLGDERREVRLVESRVHGKGLIGLLEQISDRDAAATLMGTEIYLKRDQLPGSESGHYYWTDLIGLEVINRDGFKFGRVENLMETGSNDVLVIQGDCQRLVPFTLGHAVTKVDLENKVIHVDWDPDF